MVSTFGNISLSTRRLAENADARLEIRRHDPDQQGNSRQKDEEDPKAAFDTYDNTVISIDSLRIFLENFLKSLYQKPEAVQNTAEISIETGISESAGKPVSAQASRAAGLYQSAARTVRTPVLSTPTAPTPAESGVGNDEIRTIHRLLGEIAILQARKIEYVTIERGETFLGSLAAAIAKAKQA